MISYSLTIFLSCFVPEYDKLISKAQALDKDMGETWNEEPFPGCGHIAVMLGDLLAVPAGSCRDRRERFETCASKRTRLV